SQVDAAGIDERLLTEVIQRGHHVVHFPQEAFLHAGVLVAATQRRKHHDDSGLAEGGGGLIIVGRLFRPDIADGVAVASGDPNNRRVLLAVFWVRRKVSGQLPDGRIIADRTKQTRGRIRNRFPVVSPPGELGLKALAGLSQRGHLPNLALWLARSTATPR